MRPEVEELIDAVTGEADCIDDLIDAIREQRAAMSERDIDSVNALMDETRDIFFDAQTEENRRSDLAKKLAAKFSCEPTAGSLAAKWRTTKGHYSTGLRTDSRSPFLC